jgi:hypothetical protein
MAVRGGEAVERLLEDSTIATFPRHLVLVPVSLCHGGGWSRKINAWHLYTLMVYL